MGCLNHPGSYPSQENMDHNISFGNKTLVLENIDHNTVWRVPALLWNYGPSTVRCCCCGLSFAHALFFCLLFPDSVKACHGRVLVHCQAGISRSATICLAYLIMKKRVKLEEAFEFVKQRRSIISPNFSFMGQLLQFESQVLATSCAAEAASPSGTLRERGKSSSTPTSQFVFSFPVSVAVHASPGSLPYLHSPITTSPTC